LLSIINLLVTLLSQLQICKICPYPLITDTSSTVTDVFVDQPITMLNIRPVTLLDVLVKNNFYVDSLLAHWDHWGIA